MEYSSDQIIRYLRLPGWREVYIFLDVTLLQVEVRSLDKSATASHTFPTVDLVTAMEYSPVGRYLATVESRDQLIFVRVYLNWWCPEAAAQPMRARVPGLTPSLQVGNSKEVLLYHNSQGRNLLGNG